MAVTWHLDGQLAEIALEGLLALASAGVASGVGYRFVAFVAQMLGQFGVPGLAPPLGQLFEQAVLADEVFGFLVVGRPGQTAVLRVRRVSWCSLCLRIGRLARRWTVRVYTKFCTPSRDRALSYHCSDAIKKPSHTVQGLFLRVPNLCGFGCGKLYEKSPQPTPRLGLQRVLKIQAEITSRPKRWVLDKPERPIHKHGCAMTSIRQLICI